MTEEQIWDILDGNALPEVQKEHAQLLATNAEYRVHFESFSVLHNQLCSLELDAPSMRFEQNLMERLQPSVKIQRTKDRLPLYFLGVMSILIAVFVGVLSALSVPSTEPVFAFSETPNNGLLSQFFTEGGIAWVSNPVFFYSFVILNIILFFIVLDKKVFEPFFEKRGKRD